MASFELANRKTGTNEGGWAFDPDDAGGETYRGWARNYHQAAPIWPIIDSHKSALGPVKHRGCNGYREYRAKLDVILGADRQLQEMVDDLYRAKFWDANRLSEINSQAVADWVYDHAVNAGGRGIKWAQEAAGVVVDGGVGPKTLAAWNGSDPSKLLQEMEDVAAFYRLEKALAVPSQTKFLPSWLRRDGVSEAEIAEVMRMAADGLTYSEVVALKKMIDETA